MHFFAIDDPCKVLRDDSEQSVDFEFDEDDYQCQMGEDEAVQQYIGARIDNVEEWGQFDGIQLHRPKKGKTHTNAEVGAKEETEEEEDEEDGSCDCSCSCCSNINTCRDSGYYWATLEEFESGKGRVAFPYPSGDIEEM